MRLIRPLMAAAIAAVMAQTASARDLEQIQQSGSLTVCANQRAMPVSGKTDPPGFQVEIAQEIAQTIGVRLVVEWIWADYQLRYTDCDMILGVARDPKPGGFLRYLQPLSDVKILLVFAGEKRPVAASDLVDLVIAVPSASLAHFKLLDLGADPRVAYKTDHAILAAINDGTLDGGVVSSLALSQYQSGAPDQPFFAVSTGLLGVPSAYPMTIALRKMDSLAHADFQEVLASIRQNGRLDTILARYGQTLSVEFDNPYARTSSAISEPEAVSVRKDIVEDLERRARAYKKSPPQSDAN